MNTPWRDLIRWSPRLSTHVPLLSLVDGCPLSILFDPYSVHSLQLSTAKAGLSPPPTFRPGFPQYTKMRVNSSSLLLLLLQSTLLALCFGAGNGVSAVAPLSASAEELHSRSRLQGSVFDKIRLNKHKLVSSAQKPKMGHSRTSKAKAGGQRAMAASSPPTPLSSPYTYSPQLYPRGGPFPISSPHYWSGRPSFGSTLGTLSSKLTSKLDAAKSRPGSSVPGAGGWGPTHSRYGAHALGSRIKRVGSGARRGARKLGKGGFRPLGGARRLRGYGYT